ncbi:DUF4433 domain-containing protein [Paraglaciecola agarilytica]|uniref:type II toxin-antitoxin system toxin DNA ADP-ribosyl transferase DarT n=1 Tax=Paraglaciecola chathamensis TaxID=368405 RepID=UPI001C0A2D6C|nr:DUF4433 domain-containing protein [Paraglaciecola agarilytica]MBU3019029.1 DUF4433 domain-containing protein [Paraglaciecola agarilytica]
MPTYPVPTPIYHFTHIDNLARLLGTGMLLCKNEMTAQNYEYRSSAFETVQAHREGFPVPVSRRGTIHDYVPFYFNSRSPMLFTIKCGNVNDIIMQDLVFFKTSAQTVVASGSDFAFTDGHGIMALSDYYDDLADLEEVPWNVINARYWNDFLDGKRLRQSEFLVYKCFNWSLVEVVGVYNQEMKERVEQLIANLQQPPVVEVRRNWYF